MRSRPPSHHHGSGAERSDCGGSRSRRLRPGVERLEQREVMSAIPAPPVYQNPFMAPNNYSEIHLNSYQTDTFSVPGPATFANRTVQQSRISPPRWDRGRHRGQRERSVDHDPGGSATQQERPRVRPYSAAARSEDTQGSRVEAAAFPPSMGVTFSGGGYFYLNNLDQVVCITVNQPNSRVDPDLLRCKTLPIPARPVYDVSSALVDPSDSFNSVLPTARGTSGSLARKAPWVTSIPRPGRSPSLDTGETISKSFATDGQGRVFVVTDYALYCFQATQRRHPAGLADDLRPRDD